MGEKPEERKRPTPLEIYDSEGGNARYPDDFEIRGKNANERLDRIRGPRLNTAEVTDDPASDDSQESRG